MGKVEVMVYQKELGLHPILFNVSTGSPLICQPEMNTMDAQTIFVNVLSKEESTLPLKFHWQLDLVFIPFNVLNIPMEVFL